MFEKPDILYTLYDVLLLARRIAGHFWEQIMRLTTRQKPVRKALSRCEGGPWHGHTLALDADAGCSTAWFELYGTIGRYVRGAWEAAS